MVEIKRKEYDESGTKYMLGLPYTEKTNYFEGKIESDAITIDDAFNIESLTVTNNKSNGLVALASEIAEIQAQERCLVDGLTGSLVVPGYTMQNPDNLSLVADGATDPTYNADEVTVAPLTDDEIEDKTGMTASALAEGLSATAVTLYPMQKAVSYAGTLSGVSVLCDRRKSMVGYTVDGAAEVAWVPVPKTWWDGLADEVQTALLTALGIDGVVKSMSALQSVEVDEYGVIDPDGEVEDLGNNSRVFFSANGSTDRQFADVSVDGVMQMVWRDNPSYLIGILAAVPRVSMQSVLGLAAVCVGIKGGVPSWMALAIKGGCTTNACMKLLKTFPNADYSVTNNSLSPILDDVTNIAHYASGGGWAGTSGEWTGNLFDGSTSTKVLASGMSETDPCYVVFGYGNFCLMKGYKLTTANDSTPARNPLHYAFYGSMDAETWVLIVDENRSDLPTTIYTTFSADITPTCPYRYYKFAIYSAYNGTMIQLSELSIY